MPPSLRVEPPKDDLNSTLSITVKEIPGGWFYLQHKKPQTDGSSSGPRELTVLRRTAAEGTILWGNENHWQRFMAMGGSAVYQDDISNIHHAPSAFYNVKYWEDIAADKFPFKRKADEIDNGRSIPPSKRSRRSKPQWRSSSRWAARDQQFSSRRAVQSSTEESLERSGTAVFMSTRLLDGYPIEHPGFHETESILWCLAWYVLQGTASWSEGCFTEVCTRKFVWARDRTNPSAFPDGLRPGAEQLWAPLAVTFRRWRAHEEAMFHLETKEYSDRANYAVIDEAIPDFTHGVYVWG
jgi:hypothetical protein